jgi:hypothetical protein
MKDRKLRILMASLAFGFAWGLWGDVGAFAGLDIDLAATLTAGDDNDVFLSISARYFNRDRSDIEKWSGQCKEPDDLAVLLFLSKHAGKPPGQVMKLRRGGLSWWEISQQYGIEVGVWFVPVKRDPGPPYGRAYGHWRKHSKDKRHQMSLTDVDIRNLVAVRLLHEYYGVEAEVALQWRSSGQDLRSLTAGEYRKRHGKGQSGDKPDKRENKGKKKGRGR